ncbi:MAG: helix-turn-helix transcriptional regulator [Armatimonadetes bacterium]|nr:helix-turn-helix transcriptional regulator [Armatimonadota bacterium]
MELSAFLKELVRKTELSTVVCAEQTGVSRTSLWRWLSGKSLPRDIELESLLKVLTSDPQIRARAFTLLEQARGGGVLRLQEKVGIPLLDRSILLVALRERRGWSQTFAAEQAEIPRSTLANWERGAKWPSTDRLHTLCFHYQATHGEFLALTLPFTSAGVYLDESLDLVEIRQRFERDALGQVDPIATMILAQRLGQLALTDPEAKALLCRAYAHLGNLFPLIQTRPRTKYFLDLVAKLEPEGSSENFFQYTLSLTHFIREQLIYLPTGPKGDELKRKVKPKIGRQCELVLAKVEKYVEDMPLPLQIRWLDHMAQAKIQQGDFKSATNFIERTDRVFEESGDSFIYGRLAERVHRYMNMKEYEKAINMIPTSGYSDELIFLDFSYFRAACLYQLGSVHEGVKLAEDIYRRLLSMPVPSPGSIRMLERFLEDHALRMTMKS